MAVISAVGGWFEEYGAGEDGAGWSAARWEPTALACNPHGIVQAGVHSVLLARRGTGDDGGTAVSCRFRWHRGRSARV